MPLTDLSPIDLAWLTGLFEGEGYAGIGQGCERQRVLRVNIAQKGENTANMLLSMIGFGHVEHHARNGCSYWSTSAKQAREFLSVIRPYMRLQHKIEQVDIAMTRAMSPECCKRQGLIKRYKHITNNGTLKYKPLGYELRIL